MSIIKKKKKLRALICKKSRHIRHKFRGSPHPKKDGSVSICFWQGNNHLSNANERKNKKRTVERTLKHISLQKSYLKEKAASWHFSAVHTGLNMTQVAQLFQRLQSRCWQWSNICSRPARRMCRPPITGRGVKMTVASLGVSKLQRHVMHLAGDWYSGCRCLPSVQTPFLSHKVSSKVSN